MIILNLSLMCQFDCDINFASFSYLFATIPLFLRSFRIFSLKILFSISRPTAYKAVFMCTIGTPVQICTREQIYTRVQIYTPLCCVHMPINYVHTHQDLIRNLTQGTHFMRNSLCFNVLNSVLYRCMCVRGRGRGFLEISTAECVVETFFILLSFKGQVRKAYS